MTVCHGIYKGTIKYAPSLYTLLCDYSPVARAFAFRFTSAFSIFFATAITWRPRYVPHVGHATWDFVAVLQFGHTASFMAFLPWWLRRMPFFAWDVFLFGTAIGLDLLLYRSYLFCQSGACFWLTLSLLKGQNLSNWGIARAVQGGRPMGL